MLQKIPFKITLDFGSHANISHSPSVTPAMDSQISWRAIKRMAAKGFDTKVLLQNVTLQRVSLQKLSITKDIATKEIDNRRYQYQKYLSDKKSAFCC